jgi:RNA polymerase sigma factor (sigma-70 family)
MSGGDVKRSYPIIAQNGSTAADGLAAYASPLPGFAAEAVTGRLPSVAFLVTRARDGDKQAWDELVQRFAPLIWSICRRYQLCRPAANDVGQIVWLRLADQLALVRDPAALPGWVVTTTRRECGRVLRAAGKQRIAGHPLDAADLPETATVAPEFELLRAERHAALREAFTHLPPDCQQLIAMLIQDPPVPYAQISAGLGIPVGSIGPDRSRCLEKLRRHPAIVALINTKPRPPAATSPRPATGR